MRFSLLHFALVPFLLLAIASASAADADHNPAAQNPDDVAPVKIVNVATGKILAIDFAGGQNQVVVADDSPSVARCWRIIPDGDFLTIVNPENSSNLLAKSGAASETPVAHSPNRLDPSTGHHLDNQLWTWDGTGKDRRLKSKSSNLVLDVDEHGLVVLRQANANPSQLWKAVDSKTEVSAVLTGGTGGPQQATQPILHLVNGNFCIGELVDCDQPDIVRWNCPAATGPFDFRLNAVSAIYFPPSKKAQEKAAQAADDYCVELAGGDVLFGSLSNLTADQLLLDSPTLGPLHIDRSKISRLEHRNNSADFVYFGPEGTLGWQQIEINPPLTPADEMRRNRNGPNPPVVIQKDVKPLNQQQQKKETLWHDEAGQLATDHPDAAAFGNFGIPEQATVEFDISWTTKADFVLALCLNEPAPLMKPASDPWPTLTDRKAFTHPFRIEAWDRHLVVVRESDDGADLADLMEINPATGHVHLQAYIDQKLGRILIIDEAGRQLADLTVPEKGQSKPAGGLQLINHHGDVRLEHLRISRWNGDVPADLSTDKARLRETDGTIVSGKVQEFNPTTKQFVVRDGDKEINVDADKVASVAFASAQDAPKCSLRALTQDGARISGKLEHIAHGQLKLTTPGITEPILLPVADLKSVMGLDHYPMSAPTGVRIGRFELPGIRLNGWLEASDAAADTEIPSGATCLVWHPVASQTSAPLRSDISGQIIYHEAPPAPKPQAQQVPQGGRAIMAGRVVGAGIAAVFVQGIASAASSAAKSQSVSQTLYLRTGDTLLCSVTQIDQDGVTIKTTVSNATFIPHEKIKALVLAPENRTGSLDKIQRQRLLTLPRMQKNNPPTQLVVSTDGDYLRGRLTAMDDKTASLEVHLETKQLPRDHIARIIWLHADELQDPSKPATSQPPAEPQAPAADSPSPHSNKILVQALRSDGVRLTFSPQRATDSTLAGSSDVLGDCRVDLTKVDSILIGHAIDENVAHLSYSKWKLTNAIEPRFVQDSCDENASDRPAGTDGALVGQPAPDFELKTLDGGKFKLSEHKGHLVVLDFFATWCGPCVAAMPQVDQAVHSFQADHVELLAVNMQEDAKTINGLLERLNLKPNVALDQDGATAEKYSVTAIPQTVIIDADGKVARLFIGGGPNFGDQLHDALQEVLHPPDKSLHAKTESPPATSGP